MNELVQRLAEGDHPVTAGGPIPSLEQLKDSIDRGYVFVKFTDTKGGTDLGVRMDRDRSSVEGADFEKGTGSVHIEGNLTLNYVRVRCIADIDLATLNGKGHLEIIEEVSPGQDR